MQGRLGLDRMHTRQHSSLWRMRVQTRVKGALQLHREHIIYFETEEELDNVAKGSRRRLMTALRKPSRPIK
jgi:hypothetical protein